ncbi:unnamed protein product [Allacma fusca]|uniref:EamA domain-containing protein n=1 Tax=Allacma fusca TaxID=39272 RepID=A0A8J2PP80_9HEXA|nr:unnamed protein product [Allacma fusca]
MKPKNTESDSSDEEIDVEKLKQEIQAKSYKTFDDSIPKLPVEYPPEYAQGATKRKSSLSQRLSIQLNNGINAVKKEWAVQPLPYEDLEAGKDEPKPKKSLIRKYRGLFYTLMSSLIFSVSALLVKNLHHYSPLTLAVWRFQGALIPAVPLVSIHFNKKYQEKYKKELIKKERKHGRWTRFRTYLLLLLRSILVCNALILHFYALKYLPIGDAMVINSCTPVFAYVFAFFFLGEPMGVMPMATSLVTLIGVVFIIKPPIFTGGTMDMQTLTGAGLALGSTVLGTCSFVSLRYIRRVHYSVTMLAYGLWGSIETIIPALILGLFSFPEGKVEWALAVVLVVFTFLGQCAIIMALKAEKTGPVSLIRTCDVIFGFLWQIIFFQLVPDIYSIIGATIVISGVVVITFRKWLETLNEDHGFRKKLWFLLK